MHAYFFAFRFASNCLIFKSTNNLITKPQNEYVFHPVQYNSYQFFKDCSRND